jgi:hypothetical protein
MMEIAQNKRWSFCVSPGRVVTVGSLAALGTEKKSAGEPVSPAEPQLFRRKRLRGTARADAQIAHLGQQAGALH